VPTHRTDLALPRPRPAMRMQSRLRPSVLALALTTLAAADAAAQTERTLPERLDSIAGSGIVANRAPGLVAAVVRGDDTLLFEAYGRANVEWDVPMSADAMFEIGSVTKQFTAAAILQLRDRGKLSLEDDITRWLPDFDTRGNRVPLRRLLDHTSGIVGLTEMPEFDILGLAYNPTFPRDSAYAFILRYPFQFPTGTMQIYNNSAFWLLGLVVERASGMTYGDYLETQLFQPLGMSRSMYCSSEIVPRRAHGYSIENGVVSRAHTNPYTTTFASGGICSTTGDLVAWLQALHGGRVLSPQSYAEMTSPSRLDDGTPLSYGLGMQLNTDVRGRRFMGISGGVDGFRAEVGWYPDAQMAVVVLVNSNGPGNLNPSAVGNQLMDALLPGTAPALAQFTGDAAPLLGRYRGPSRGGDMLVEVTPTPEGIALSVNGSPARPATWVEGWTFRQGSGTILSFLRRGESGPATELRYSSPGAHHVLRRQ
jgi:CubicO group peptidase (beta-lactamase class C family)